ncbi:hypothetical protein HD806DRAFT_89931 [Xylariaceae sp. AK1471]|nr:hypothetical protein HD806DRAFT_89931 [Xylariaceae sp. AK1471]
MDTRKLTTAQKSGASYDKGAATKTNNNNNAAATTTTTKTGGQVEGVGKTHLTSPQANTAMTTDGFKDDGVEGGIIQQGDDGAPITTTVDGTLPLAGDHQQQQQKQQKNDKFSDWNQVDESAQKVQQGGNNGNKLKNMFGRLKKGSDGSTDETVEEQGQGEREESEARQKIKGDDVVKE